MSDVRSDRPDQLFSEENSPIFLSIVDKTLDAILVTDSDFRIAYANAACRHFLAHPLTGRMLRSIWFKDDLLLLDHIIDWVKVGGFFSAARLNGFRRIVDLYPNIEIVGTLAGDWDREKGRQRAAEFLTVNPPGTLDVIWAASSEMALGALMAVEAAGRQDEVKIFSNDLTPESAACVGDGRLLAETHHGFPEWGWYGAQFAVMLALGKPVPQVFDIRPRTICADNVAWFYPIPRLEIIDWDEIASGCTVPDKIVIGWIQMAEVGVYRTATEYFDKAAADARSHGIEVEIITRIPLSPEDFVGQAAIIEDFIQQQVNVIACSTISVDVIKAALLKAARSGIPTEEQERIFENFYRAANVGTIRGTGLGLSIVRHAVQMQGGTIALESSVGSGSTFTVRLPRYGVRSAS